MRHLLSAVFLLTTLTSQSVHAISLIEAWQQALKHDPEYQSALHANDAGQQERAIGRAALLPTLSWDYQRSQNDSTIINGSRRSDRQYGSHVSALSLQQPLLDYEKWARYQRGNAGAQKAEQLLRDRYQQLIVRLFRAYSNALFSREQNKLVAAQQKVFREQYQLNQRLFDAGEGTRTDILETEAKLNLIDAQWIETQDNVDISLQELGALTGTVPEAEDLAELMSNFIPAELKPNNHAYWLSLAMRHNAQLLAFNQSLVVAKYDIERLRAGHFPRATLVASYRDSKSDAENSVNQRYHTNSIGVQISVPLFSGGGVIAATRQSQAQYQQAFKEKDQQVAAIQTELRRQFNLLTSSRAKIIAYQLAEKSARALVTATRQSVRGGERINLDVLNAQLQLYSVRRDLSEARYSWLTSWLELHYYAGILDDRALQQLAGYFQNP